MMNLDFEQPKDVSDDLLQRLMAQFTRRDLDLPALSTTAVDLMEMTASPDAEVEEVAELIQKDQGLSSHLLRVANAAAFAPEVRITSIPQAVARLGMGTMTDLAVTLIARDELFGPLMRKSRLVREMWQHSAVAGVYARRIGLLQREDHSSSIMVGLLADVGQPVAYKLLRELCREMDEPLSPETILYLIDVLHVPLGALLAETWRLPEQVSVAIEHHHDYANVQGKEHGAAAMVAHLSDQLATWCLHPETREDQDFRELPVIQDLGLQPQDLGLLFADPEEAREAAAAFS